MEQQIKKNKASLKKVRRGIERALNGEFQNNELILDYMMTRERILEKTQEKLFKMNKKHFLRWESPQNTLIS